MKCRSEESQNKIEVLKINKTKICKILQANGYYPGVRQSAFSKAKYVRSWWLQWDENGVWHTAYMSASGGSAFISVKANGEDRLITLTLDYLRNIGATEVITKHGTD